MYIMLPISWKVLCFKCAMLYSQRLQSTNVQYPQHYFLQSYPILKLCCSINVSKVINVLEVSIHIALLFYSLMAIKSYLFLYSASYHITPMFWNKDAENIA